MWQGHHGKSCVSLTGQGHEEHHHCRQLPGHDWGAREYRCLAKGLLGSVLSKAGSSEWCKANSRAGSGDKVDTSFCPLLLVAEKTKSLAL